MDRHAASMARKSYRKLRKRRRKGNDDDKVSDSEPSESSDIESDDNQPGNERAAQNRVQENELQGGNLDGTEDSSDEQEDDSQMSEDGTSEDELAVADAGGASDESLELDGNDEGAGRESDQSSSDGNDPESEEEYLQGESQSEQSEPESEDDLDDESDEASYASSEDVEDDPQDDEGRNPGGPITLHESLCAIFSLVLSETLSGQLVGKILQLIALHCPANSILKKTLFKFKKYFARLSEAFIVFHYFCSDCMFPVRTKTSACRKCKKTGENISFFLELPIVNQLQHLFKRENFYEDLQFRFKPNRKREADNIEDIFDGNIYEAEMESGFLRGKSNLSFMWYSDGVKIFKSARFSIWPLCLVINELPYKKRTLPENKILCGLWFGNHKPSPNIFLRSLRKSMKKLQEDGHVFKLSDNSEVHVKCKVLCGTADMPAKSKFLQFKQYNGEYSCPRCLQAGGRAPVGKTTVQVYPYTPGIPDRTHEETLQHAREALEARKTNKDAAVCGVKGPTLLSKIVPDLIRCTTIDVMHGVFIGVCKLLIDLWFNSNYSRQPWSLVHLADIFDQRLKEIKPPSHAVRAPRSLKEVKFWKASEFKLFLLYYSIPVLKGLMEDVYFKHHCKLVSAISLLSQDSISKDQIVSASGLLVSYVSDFALLYPLRFLGINVHQLLHLPSVVLDLGPLFVYSTFFLESLNGQLNKFFHGTQHVALQICSTASMYMQVPIIRKTLPHDSKALQFCLTLEKRKPFKVAEIVDEVTYAVGKYNRNHQQVIQCKRILQEVLQMQQSAQFDVFYRLNKNSVMYFSKDYRRVSKRNESSFVSFLHDDQTKLGQIMRFVKCSHCANTCDVGCNDCPTDFYAIIELYNRRFWFIHEMPEIRLPHFWGVEKSQKLVAVPVQSLINVCFFISIDNNLYIAWPINRLEIE